jgi:hypothetical protein
VWATRSKLDGAHVTERASLKRSVEARREFFELTHAEARALFDTVALLSGPRAGREAREAREAREGREPQSEAVRARGAVTAEEKLRAWVDSKYTRIPLREKDTGSKLEALHTAGAPELPGQDNLREDAMLGLSWRRPASRIGGGNGTLLASLSFFRYWWGSGRRGDVR